MTRNKIITYSLLAYINNNRTLSSGLLDLFVPIVKQALSALNQEGITSGKSITEIKNKVDIISSLNIPLPVLTNILHKICREINTPDSQNLIIYNDGAFSMKNYSFVEYDEIIERKKQEIDNLEKLFQQFCSLHNVKPGEYHSVFDFIDRNKLSISRYLGGGSSANIQSNFLLEAQFISYFKLVPDVYNTIRNIYLGSIISTYIEFSTEESHTDVELVFDTNFIVGLHDLNTPESSHTCNQLVEIARKLGFKLTVLDLTVKEVQSLLKARAENFDKAFLQRKVNPEDIYNACDRRGLNKTDLQRFSDNLEAFLLKKGIITIHNTEKYQNIAKFSQEYTQLKKIRSSDFAALHDATATHYVREKRGKKIYLFEDVNCWFVHNSNNSISETNDGTEKNNRISSQPEYIKADDLLNIFWLSSPGFAQELTEKQLTDFGLNALISSTISDALPKASLIRELDDNIRKYIADDSLNEKDIIRVATRISTRELTQIEELNKLEEQSPEKFIEKIRAESEKQKQQEEKRAKKFEEILDSFKERSTQLKAQQDALEEQTQQTEAKVQEALNQLGVINVEKDSLENNLIRERNKRLQLENAIRGEKREAFIKNELFKWRRKSWIEFALCILLLSSPWIWAAYMSNGSPQSTIIEYETLKGSFIISTLITLTGIYFSAISIKTLFIKYRNSSNIKAFREMLEIPKNLQNINEVNDLE